MLFFSVSFQSVSPLPPTPTSYLVFFFSSLVAVNALVESSNFNISPDKFVLLISTNIYQ